MIGLFRRRRRREIREGYSDGLTLALIREAEGVDVPRAQAEAVAAVEAAAGMFARAFASADVDGDPYGVLTPSLLACIGRELVRHGESLHLIGTRGGRLMLTPCTSWDVFGEWNPATWRYEVELAGPDSQFTVTRTASGIVHARWAVEPSRPWKGIGPLQFAGLSSELLSSIETRLGQEAAAPVAQVIPSPSAGEETGTLRQTIKDAKGGLALVPTMAGGGWTGDRANAPVRDWHLARLGANPPESLRALRTDVGRAVAGACGIPADLIEAGSDAAGQREAYRRWLWSSVVPVGRLVAEELSSKLEADVSFTFDSLGAGDVQGRTRAYKQLVEAGMPPADAARIAGLSE